jgi:hemoglobin
LGCTESADEPKFGTPRLESGSFAAQLAGMEPASTIDDHGIRALVDAFYAKVRRDPQIGPIFNAAVHDWDAHLATLADFWSSVMLTTGRYKGNPMAAHMKQPIRPEFFDRWLALWRETTHEMFQPELARRFVEKAERIGESLKLGLFYRPQLRIVPRP